MINVNLIYPVGSIYISINSKNPGDIFGGTWERIKGKMLVGVDEDDTDFNSSGKTGGEKEVTLTVDKIPGHIHTVTGYAGTGQWASGEIWFRAAADGGNATKSKTTSSTGGGQPHNNMPPYYTVYIFVRTA